MTRFEKIKEHIDFKIIELCIAYDVEKQLHKEAFAQLKEDLKVNLIDGIKSGVVFANIKENTKALFTKSNYDLGLKSQSIPNRINVVKYKDRSRNFVNGRKYRFDLSFYNRWDMKLVNTHICLTKGLIVPKEVNVSCNGVQFPPRFKY